MARFPSLPMILAGSLLISACGSSPASPGSNTPGGMSAPAAAGSARPEAGSEKITLKGSVASAYDGEGLDHATLIVQALTSDALPAATSSMGASGSLPMPPNAMPSSMPSPTGAPTAMPTVGGRQGAAAPRRPAPLPDDPKRPRKITVDDKGQFEIPDMAPGTYQITAYAPGYEALTIVGNRPSQNLTMPLVPRKTPQGYEMSGTVLTAAKKPASGVQVVAGLPSGFSAGEGATTGSDGNFVLKDLRQGPTPLAAFLEDDGEIKAWSLQSSVNVAYGSEKKVPKPELTLRAVAQPLILSGVATSSASDMRPRQVSVRLATEKGELPLLSRTPDREGYFRFALPTLAEGQTYHLVVAAADAMGNVVYQHQHKIIQSNLKLEVNLSSPPKQPVLNIDEEPYVVSWEAYDMVSAYRVRLESEGDDGETLWEAYVNGTRVTLPDPDLLPLLKKGTRYRLTLTAIKVVNGFDYQLAQMGKQPWDMAASSAPLAFVYGDFAPNPLPGASGSFSPLPLPEPVPHASAKPGAKTIAKPKAKPKPHPAMLRPSHAPGKVVVVPTPLA